MSTMKTFVGCAPDRSYDLYKSQSQMVKRTKRRSTLESFISSHILKLRRIIDCFSFRRWCSKYCWFIFVQGVKILDQVESGDHDARESKVFEMKIRRMHEKSREIVQRIYQPSRCWQAVSSYLPLSVSDVLVSVLSPYGWSIWWMTSVFFKKGCDRTRNRGHLLALVSTKSGISAKNPLRSASSNLIERV